jgi:hypothetical protein
MSTVMEGRVRAPARLRPPNQIAQNLTGRPYLSYTQINLMRSCPRKFSFQYVENAKKDFLPVSLIFGGAIHSALELYFRARLEGEAVSSTGMMAAFSNAWQRQVKEAVDVPVRFGKGDDQQTILDLARRMIDAFLASPLSHSRAIGRRRGQESQSVIIDSQNFSYQGPSSFASRI